MAEQYGIAMIKTGGKTLIRKGDIWQCAPCAGGSGTCCSRKDLQPAAKAKPVVRNIHGADVEVARARVRAARVVKSSEPDLAVVAKAAMVKAAIARMAVPNHLVADYDRQRALARLGEIETYLRERDA